MVHGHPHGPRPIAATHVHVPIGRPQGSLRAVPSLLGKYTNPDRVVHMLLSRS